MPAGVAWFSMAVKTERPKKKGRPQSKPGIEVSSGNPGMGPARLLNAKAEAFNFDALVTLNTTVALAPFKEESVALRLVSEGGQ